MSTPSDRSMLAPPPTMAPPVIFTPFRLMKYDKTVTGQRRKQRKFIYNAPAHIRARMMVSQLAKNLREEYKVKNMPIVKGDVVKVVHGGEKIKVTGKVTRVDRRTYRIYVEGANHTMRKPDAKPKQIPIHPSKCLITEMVPTQDRLRAIARRHGKAYEGKPKKQ